MSETVQLKKKRYSKQERTALLEELNSHCAYCGCELNSKNIQFDHIVPLERGGVESLENIFPVCKECNKYKGTQTLKDFKTTVARIPISLGKRTASFRFLQRMGFVPNGIWDVEFYYEKLISEGKKLSQSAYIDACDCSRCMFGETNSRIGISFSKCAHPSKEVRDKNSGEFIMNCCSEFILNKDGKTEMQ